MSRLFRFPNAVKRESGIEAWLHEYPDAISAIARCWFEVLRDCGDDVREVLHDGHPTACAGDAAFAYVDAFSNHVSVGFFRGAELPDANGLLQGAGKFMRHVKLKPGQQIDDAALRRLIRAAYDDMQQLLKTL